MEVTTWEKVKARRAAGIGDAPCSIGGCLPPAFPGAGLVHHPLLTLAQERGPDCCLDYPRIVPTAASPVHRGPLRPAAVREDLLQHALPAMEAAWGC